MLLGDLIARFSDGDTVNETLLSLGDFALAARVVAGAANNGMSAGEFVVQSVGRFVNSASDDEWLSLMGQMSRADDPGEAFLRCALSKIVSM